MTARLLLLSIAGAALLSLTPACDSASATCGVAGATQECVCAGAADGGQACLSDGTWSECDCTTGAGAESRSPRSDTAADTLSAPCGISLGAHDAPDALWLGAILPLTGSLAEFGVGMRNGIELALADHAGEPVAITVCDTGTTEAGTTAAAASLVAAGVPAIIGPATSAGLLSIFEDLILPAGVLLLSPSATSPVISDLVDDDLVWRVAPSDALQGVAIGAYLLDAQVGRVAILHRSDPYGGGLVHAIVDMLCLAASGTCDEPALLTLGFEDAWAVDLAPVIEHDPDVVVVVEFGEAAAHLVGELAEAGLVRVAATEGVTAGDLASLPTEALCRLTVFAMASPSGASWEAFSDAYEDAYAAAPAAFAPNAYDAASLLLAAAASGATDGAGFAAALADLAASTTEGASGPLAFDLATGDVATAIEARRVDVATGELVSVGVALAADGTPVTIDDAHATGLSCP